MNKLVSLSFALTVFLAVASPAQEPSDPGSAAVPPEPLKGIVRKGYVDSTTGQIHYRFVKPTEQTKAPVVFLPPNPSTSLYFSYMMEDLGNDRMVLAFDTPGYGNSDRPPTPPTIEAYAAAIAEALINLGYGPAGGGKVDISGYHTGSFIAAEVAASRPDLIRRVVLLGVPFWEGDKYARMKRQLVDEPGPAEGVHEDGRHVDAHWQGSVAHRNPNLPLERANELFIERLRGGATTWWGYNAVINYDARARLQTIAQPVLLLNNHGGLVEDTRNAAALIKNATLVDMPELTTAIFDVGHAVISAKMREFLDK